MSASSATKAARHAIATIGRGRPTQSQSKKKQQTPRMPPRHGEEIWVYQHLQTRQIIYSLFKAMNNNAALKQIPFNGKKTVPPSLRKDHWAPLAQILFPAPHAASGLSVFQKLREFRVRHEHEWTLKSMRSETDNAVIPRKKRGFVLMDQKANSVADMAEVLRRLWDEEGAREIGLVAGLEKGTYVDVRWSNILDAEFAQTWSENVVHDSLEVTTNHRPLPKRMRELVIPMVGNGVGWGQKGVDGKATL